MTIVLCDGCGNRIMGDVFKATLDDRSACSPRCLTKLGISVPDAVPCTVWFIPKERSGH
jgi:hypothetical protein